MSAKNKVWKKFRRNPLAMAGLVFIFLMTLVSVLGSSIRPDQTEDANHQVLPIARQKPGTKVKFYTLASGEEVPIKSFTSDDSLRLVLFDGSIINYSLDEAGNSIFERTYFLGTDKYGRDLLSRLMAGTFISLSVGAVAVFISLLVGIVLGLIAGFYRGTVDAVIMWFINVIWAVPTLLLVMAITFAFGTGFWKVFLAVGLTMWVEVARITRGQVLSIREKEYVEAARSLGFGNFRIMFRHILPNIWSPIIVISAANFASAILIEAGLSFLGLGAQIPTPSWGNMIREHYAFLTTDLAYLAIVPGVLIMLLVLSFMMVGNGLRDALDVRS
ncbi:MAG: ABC transporter permease [Flavobacteriales bacterium]